MNPIQIPICQTSSMPSKVKWINYLFYIPADFKKKLKPPIPAAERARAEYPDEDWLHLTALIHDLGKVMAFYEEPQWAVVGDTFPVGCLWSKNIVYRDDSFEGNPDGSDARYNTVNGMYQAQCGIQNLTMSWGHDEYMYRVLKHNKSTLPERACNIIRYHSFYPWHTSGNYAHFEKEGDEDIKKWVNIFKWVYIFLFID